MFEEKHASSCHIGGYSLDVKMNLKVYNPWSQVFQHRMVSHILCQSLDVTVADNCLTS